MISGKACSEYCKWVVDPRYPNKPGFSYAASHDKDWVFINGDYIDRFFTLMPLITTKRYFVIVHNSDLIFTESKLERLRKYVYRVYAINTNFSHPRVTTIPIGFMDNQLEFLATFQPSNQERDIEIYLNFKPHHNFEKRLDCIRAFEGDPRVTVRDRVTVPEYYTDLCRSKFVLCPEGTGIDTHRVYEAMLCGATPVVLRNSLSHLYEKLPVCIVNSWTDTFHVPERKKFETHVRAYL
jgi:hypothetical protein